MRAFDGATPANESAASAAGQRHDLTPPTRQSRVSTHRPSNTTCLAGDAPSSKSRSPCRRCFPNLPDFTQPIAMLQAPGNSARWYVVQKTGSVRVFDNTAECRDVARVHQYLPRA